MTTLENSDSIPITIKFSGGAELLFDNIKKRDIILPPLGKWKNSLNDSKWTIRHLLKWLEENYLMERPEMFFQSESVRPGILVLINDVDWELVGQLDYEIKSGDSVLFMSTLHGG